MAEARDGLAIIEQRELAGFKMIADELELGVYEVARVEGFNYSRGQEVSLHFFRTTR